MKHDYASATDAGRAASPPGARRRPKLNDEHREYIVRRLATYVRRARCGARCANASASR